MMAERGVNVSHTTIVRWVLRHVPEFERRWARYERPVQPSWRIDEIAVSVRGGRHYLYRAVHKYGNTVESLLCADRSKFAAEKFFRKPVARQQGWPLKINLDGNAASHRALRLLRKQDPRWRSVIVRSRRYLNNIVEQDHRAIKRRCAWMAGFKSFDSAAITLAGIELAHRVRKRQFSFGRGRQRRDMSLKRLWDLALALGRRHGTRLPGWPNDPGCTRTEYSSLGENHCETIPCTGVLIPRFWCVGGGQVASKGPAGACDDQADCS
jgi:transposase-like protein